ncbi:hypothetical protein [Streptomyces sp. NPDC059802]|uniref:hypothetical protein n=1 Tax=Streptomyces sp. NPDC059802 TaxID=3346952 RepID=UPI00365EB063
MTTKHSHKPNFGKKVDGCPRCGELKAGAEPVSWNVRHEVRLDEQRRRSINAHFAANGPHARGVCGPVCTFGDW